MYSVLVESKPPPAVSVRHRPSSSAALSSMNQQQHQSGDGGSGSSGDPSNSTSQHHLSMLAKVLRLFRSHSDSAMAPRPPSPPRRRFGPPRSSSASPCTIASQQQQVPVAIFRQARSEDCKFGGAASDIFRVLLYCYSMLAMSAVSVTEYTNIVVIK